MNTYNPLIEPNKDEWLESSEYDRIDAVREFHENSDDDEFEEDNALSIHSTLHVIVENQLAMGVDLIPETIAKLTRQGLDRHEAIHAIGAIISEDIFHIMSGERTEFSPKRYRKKLDKITAKRWRKGQY
jgi:hypothetical protein